jgi:hypothetical protein
MPDGVPQIYFEDGSPPIGFPGPVYYPTLLEATVEVTRGPDGSSGGEGGGGSGGGDPTDPSGEAPGAPEPTSALLLAGFALGGLIVRRVRRPARK